MKFEVIPRCFDGLCPSEEDIEIFLEEDAMTYTLPWLIRIRNRDLKVSKQLMTH